MSLSVRCYVCKALGISVQKVPEVTGEGSSQGTGLDVAPKVAVTAFQPSAAAGPCKMPAALPELLCQITR